MLSLERVSFGRKKEADFGHDYLKNKKERFVSLFLSSIF